MTAFRAVYADWKLIKTRSVVQVVLELPVEQADAAYEVLGGMPVAGKERWFGIAALKPETEVMPTGKDVRPTSDARPDQVSQPRPDRAKRDWRDLPASQQAALRCDQPMFRAFLNEEQQDVLRGVVNGELSTKLAIYELCQIKSRSDLDTNHKARVIWHQLDSRYQAWLAKERVGA